MAKQIPNIITGVRIALTVVFLVLYLKSVRAAAIIVLAVVMASDLVDGWLARRFGWQTKLGAILDPVSDKLSLILICVCLIVRRLAPWWYLAALAAKEAAMLVLGAMCLHRHIKVLPARWYGKASTLITNIVVCFNLVFPAAAASVPVVRTVMYAGSVAFAYVAFICYTSAHLKNMRENSQINSVQDAGELPSE